MSFLETPRFPGCPKFGYVSEPVYSVTITRTAGGFERRNANWSRPLIRVGVTVGPGEGADDEIQELLEFWHAVGGQATGFRFKDYTDFKSCRVSDAVVATDQPLISTAASPGDWILAKAYTAGANTQYREIYKPVDGTILIADNGVTKTETTDYVIDYTTGVVTLNFSPAGALTWGGEFDTPMRFASEFPMEIITSNYHSVSCTLQEIRIEVD